ncbi:30S ribosomal protein S21 [Tenacibaculum sp. MEBiC06402]|uniref:30S ribosomal protein S21 n=1 Tax=unclassified Tenacibaculum TaxID=2635139 RepID=UPI003B999248
MLRILVKEDENIDRAIKRYRRKFSKTQILKQVRERKEYKKPSVERREQLQKAQYREEYLRKENS